VARSRQPINHGTIGGYRTHYRHGVPMCEPCLAANRRARGYKGPQPVAAHGTRAGYNRHRRNGEEACLDCRKANSQATTAYRLAHLHRGTTLAPWDARHGTRNGYSNFSCRCRACTAANARASADYRVAHQGASS
jgi:hypothetical protein